MAKKERKKVYVDMDRLFKAYNEKTEKKLSQVEYCEKYNITTATFGNYRSGKAPEVFLSLKEMLEDAGVSYEEVVNG